MKNNHQESYIKDVVYRVDTTNISGILHVIDYDRIIIPNTSSSILFTAEEAFNETKKIDSCNQILSLSKKIKPDPFDGDYNDFIKDGNLERNYPDILLSLANERNIWSTIQYNCPPLVLHATTTRNWGINFGRHIPFKEWCIVCRFGMTQKNPAPVCANSSLQNEQGQEEILGILPFLAPASAIQIVSEIIKLNLKGDGYPYNKNFLQFSLKNNGTSNFHLQQMSKKNNCPICNNQVNDEYPSDYFSSRYYNI